MDKPDKKGMMHDLGLDFLEFLLVLTFVAIVVGLGKLCWDLTALLSAWL